MNTSVFDDEEERTSDSLRSPNSHKTVVRIPSSIKNWPNPIKNETLDTVTKVFYILINKIGETKADKYQKMSDKVKN